MTSTFDPDNIFKTQVLELPISDGKLMAVPDHINKNFYDAENRTKRWMAVLLDQPSEYVNERLELPKITDLDFTRIFLDAVPNASPSNGYWDVTPLRSGMCFEMVIQHGHKDDNPEFRRRWPDDVEYGVICDVNFAMDALEGKPQGTLWYWPIPGSRKTGPRRTLTALTRFQEFVD